MITFAWQWAFFLVFVPLIVQLFRDRSKPSNKALKIPFFSEIENIKGRGGRKKTSKMTFIKIIVWMLWLALIISAARPQSVGDKIPITNESRIIVLILDASGSMKENDFTLGGNQVSRFDAMKQVVADFIKKRPGDKIGLVLFGSNAYIYAPPTDDTKSLLYLLDTTEPEIAGGKTAIGDGLGMAVKMVQDLPKEKRTAILLSDGISNAGSLSEEQALLLAKENDLQVYTIGMGSGVGINFLGFNVLKAPSVDEEALQQIANQTGGKFYMAQNTAELASIYNEIDRLEPIANEDKFYQPVTELFYIPLATAFVLSIFLVFMLREKKNVR